MLTINNGQLLNADPKEVRERVEHLISEITQDTISLQRKAIKLGIALNEVKIHQYWEQWGFHSFGDYIRSLKDLVERGRTQLYGYQSAVEKLLPFTDEDTLEKIGITKATEITKAMKITGRAPTSELLTAAADKKTTTGKLRERIAREWHVHFDQEKGKWYDLEGFFVTKSELQEIEQAYDAARKTDPPIPADWPASEQRKEIILRLCREYVSTYGELAVRGEA